MALGAYCIKTSGWSRMRDGRARLTGEDSMSSEFTAIIERDGNWYIAYCAEIPGANGQGRTKKQARESLAQAIKLILEDRRDDALRGLPSNALRETVTVK